MGCGNSKEGVQETSQIRIAPSTGGADVKKEETKGGETKKEEQKKIAFPEVTIYFGSQTGNSSRFANELMQESEKKYDIKGKIVDLIEFDEKELAKKTLAIFIVSTYGEGGPTDNAQRFYQWLINEHMRSQEKDMLKSLRFTVYGCGDSSFSKTFNRMAKLTSENLKLRGAQQ